MFWDKKEEKKLLPDLPPMKEDFAYTPPQKIDYEDSDDEVFERHSLPAFPDSAMKRGFSQTAIKDAVSTEEKPSSNFRTLELNEWSPNSKSIPHLEEKTNKNFETTVIRKEKADVYIKIDRFQSAKRAINKIKQDIEEVDNLLKKIRETKIHEEQVLTAWEKQIVEVRTQVQGVTENIFERLE